MSLRPILDAARQATHTLLALDPRARTDALERVADAIAARTAAILAANAEDVSRAAGLAPALVDRLRLDERRLDGVVSAVRQVAALPDVLGVERELGRGPSGIVVKKRRIPLGVIGIVYEARPNVTVECAALTIKSGNAVVLRGGKEAERSNRALEGAIRAGLEGSRVPPDAVQLVGDPSRERVIELLQAVGEIDLVIPRGGAALMELVDAHARVPVIRHGQGICHVYVDEHADPKMAVEIAVNSKAQRPGVCNAMETLLVHERRLADVLPPIGRALADRSFELRADPAALAVLAAAGIGAKPATAVDFDTEFLGPVLAIRSVETLDAALRHVAQHGTRHTASIVTNDEARARRFLAEVDASCVLWNASTRLNDGGELGLGAEMGISTTKMHAFGPMGIAELTAEKFVVYGTGQVRT